MLKPSFQWRRSGGRIMEFELIQTGPGAQAPGQKKKKKKKATSTKRQASSTPAGLSLNTIKIYK